MIIYNIEKHISELEFQDILNRSTLADRRPAKDLNRLKDMIENADLIVTARLNNQLIGIARSITDFAYCTYLSDLAIDFSFQKQGVGRELIRQTKIAAPMAKLILLSAPGAVEYYPKIGMKKHDFCFYLDNANDLRIQYV